MIDESGLTFTQMKVLVELEAAEEDERTVTALSEELGISAASASRAADGLVRKKLATRVEDADDRQGPAPGADREGAGSSPTGSSPLVSQGSRSSQPR